MGGLGAGAPLTQSSSSQQGARLGSGLDTPTEKGLALEEDGEGWGQEVVHLGSGGPPRKENHFQQVHLSMLPATHPTPALSHPPLGSGKYIPPDWPRVPALCTLPVQAGPWIGLC